MLKKIFFTHTLDFTTTTVRMANSLKKNTSGLQVYFLTTSYYVVGLIRILE